MLLPLAGALASMPTGQPRPSARKTAVRSPFKSRPDPVIVLLVVVNFGDVLSLFGTGGILAGLLFVAIGYGVGWDSAVRVRTPGRVLGLGTAQRNIAAALVVGSQSFSNPSVVVMVIVVGFSVSWYSYRYRGCWQGMARQLANKQSIQTTSQMAERAAGVCVSGVPVRRGVLLLGGAVRANSARSLAKTGQTGSHVRDVPVRKDLHGRR